jgi:hypothetical protein
MSKERQYGDPKTADRPRSTIAKPVIKSEIVKPVLPLGTIKK